MAQLTEDEVRHIARLARLKLSDEEVQKFSRELTSILEYIGVLNELDTENVEPTAQVTGLQSVFREDEVRPSEATKDELLACSPLPIVNDQIETLSAHG
jgi:aspartyl-tRNA(Asn)/glutamyl-tRNA(Gln) amidotransferase subunit C